MTRWSPPKRARAFSRYSLSVLLFSSSRRHYDDKLRTLDDNPMAVASLARARSSTTARRRICCKSTGDISQPPPAERTQFVAPPPSLSKRASNTGSIGFDGLGPVMHFYLPG